jgi:ribosomal protein L12E/L44/L45/RPP1/RPP2
VRSARANTSAERSDEHLAEVVAGAEGRPDGRALMTSLAPVPSESQTCANCSAPLVADQRYCLSCGQPVSPVRLAFLDVLESERQPQQLGAGGATNTMPVAFTPYIEPAAGPAWLRRYAPLFGVLSVLLLALIVGLLVGHWVTQSKAPATAQVIKVEGLGGLGGLATGGSATTPTSTTPATGTSKSSSSAKSEEEKEEAEAKKEEKEEETKPAKAPEAKKVSSSTLGKLNKTTGKAHEKELNTLSHAPIEVK